MSSYTVNVSGIAPQTTEPQLNEFFTFCGKIKSIDYNKDAHTAAVHFEKPSAAKTAQMLNGGTLDGATLTVTSEADHPDEHAEDHTGHPELEQSDKPRAGIAAEYLAKGYTLSDQVLQKAIEIDTQRGISKRFLAYLQGLDSSLGAKLLGEQQTISGKAQDTATSATQQAKALDEQRGISKTAIDYYSKALSTPIGQKVKQFYTTTSKQVVDIHEEAKRIQAEEKAHAPEAPKAAEEPKA